jgi:hypothetical protein
MARVWVFPFQQIEDYIKNYLMKGHFSFFLIISGHYSGTGINIPPISLANCIYISQNDLILAILHCFN